MMMYAIGVTDAVQDDANQTTYIAVGVGIAGILLGLITGVVATVIVMRKKNGKAVRGLITQV